MSLPQPPAADSHVSHHHDEDQNLESLLKLAATESIHRTAFFRALLDATVLVLVDDSEQHSEDGEMTFTAGNGVNILHWEKQDGESVIPFFTSVEVLQQALDIAEDQPIGSEKLSINAPKQPFIAMPVRVLFEMTQGAHLFLNPKSEHGKEFWPQEVAMLLENGGLAQPAEMVVDKESQILLGQPEEYPSAMVDALIQLFSQRKPVRRAFLALMHDKSVDEKPNLLVGLEVDGSIDEIDQLIQEAGNVASDHAPDDGPVDFCVVNENERGVSHYLMTHTQAFYQRRWGSWLRNAIPASSH
ncbi:enhanced serine sensitivity protein SseB [Yersinia enterocolitica]|uniref:enhanced serine sensitivity protein SseB n=1 Tax=Yersinia enterocolitica TaxID=630 RepID=UPI0005DC2415|nr:enhanced serine sensitivity protein SseB [Yersinia enterocolitica]CNK08724.1 enhanced serine sensitivity protein SseB [Yersinia enterocolitica]CRY24400.1 enhanced serine sensitivity protein SseB [Yersinia enterocolitica]HDL8465818.1 enhanced serine sensitivity protein SseB [Yersinia enterocolitica]HDL8490475.1 enhanced serine sensitivity protein SseB [Yersinia enterocolitica]HDL8511002.1 enhanced serine sensitivity protein SseB [Yersinia enterocolitica]